MLSEQLEKVKIVPVLVLNTLDEGLAVCEQLCRNGLPAAEITFRTAAAESVIREAVKRFPDMFIGAGTVLNIADAQVDHRSVQASRREVHADGRSQAGQCRIISADPGGGRRRGNLAEQV